MRVAIFTDNDFDKTNGVTTTLRAVLRHAPADLHPRIYTLSDMGCATDEYLALTSIGMPIPWYGEMRMYLPLIRAFRRHLRADHAAVVHITTPGPVGLAAKYLAACDQLPTIGSFHTQLAEYTTILTGSSRLGQLMNRYMRWLYGGCAQILAPSEDTRRRLAEAGWEPGRIAIWPRGVDTDVFSPDRRSSALRERWRVCERRPAILYAGRLSREKGLALLPALESLLYRARASYRLILAGDGPMSSELQAACPDAVFLGRLPHREMGAVMASADLFIFPSDTDTAGNVVLEAQACGVPVLVSDRGGPHEQIVDGTTGFVCAAGNQLAFASRAVELLQSRELRARMADAARHHARTRGWQAALEPLFSAYRALGSAAAGAAPVASLQTHAGALTRW